MFWEWKRYGSEILSIDRLLNKELFYGKVMECKNPVGNVPQKLVPGSFFIFVNNPKLPLKIFFLNPVPFNGQYHEKQKGPGTGD